MINFFYENVEILTVFISNITVAFISGIASYKAAKIGVFKNSDTKKLSKKYVDKIREEIMFELYEELNRIQKRYNEVDKDNMYLRKRIALKRKYIYDLQQHILKKLPPPPPEQPCYDEILEKQLKDEEYK